MARVYMTNVLINGTTVFTYLMLYVASALGQNAEGLFKDEINQGYHVTADNDFITIWIVANLGLSIFEMIISMCFMIRLSYENFYH